MTRKSACEWHPAWMKGDKATLVSKGTAGTGCKLTEAQLTRLKAFLDEGAIAHGWDDQRWTSARIAALIAERFHIRYTPSGVAYLMERLGWSFQVPAHRAARRDEEEEIASWRRQVWLASKAPGRPGAPGSSSPMSPARTWALARFS
ncbi:helix-turn-helix domain-containing protein [Streptosporangium sp. NPDC004631]